MSTFNTSPAGGPCVLLTRISISFFEKNKDYFLFNGGDMEILFHKCKIAHSKRVFTLSPDIKKKLTFEDIQEGFNLYLQNDEEDRRIYKNALLAQRYLIERLSIKSSIRFSCFQKEALWNNADFYWFNDEGKEEKWNNLYDFAYHFDDHTADPKGQLDNFIYPNHFSPKGQKAMEQIIRTAINEYSN